MVKKPQSKKPEEVETRSDGWERFQNTMDKIVPPKRRKDDLSSTGAPEQGKRSKSKLRKAR